MLDKLQRGYQIWRHFGTDWMRFRVLYTLRQRTGGLKRKIPVASWAQQPLTTFLTTPALGAPETYLQYRRTQAPPFFFSPTDRACYRTFFERWDDDTNSPIPIAEDVAQGILCYFEHAKASIGFPPDWHKNPFSGQVAPSDRHWSEIPDFGYGDIKVIWEPSRFGFVYTLVRAYWRTGDERYPDLFWQLVADWRLHNPPQVGPNWKCGQETSFRVMAWCFGLYGFLGAKATTEARVVELAQTIAISGQRIEANLDYALSQRNNHGISEGMGLWTIGLLFPELQKAKRWMQRGRQVLEDLGRELIYEDGSFVQHSVNYHRLMLHDYLWAIRLGELQGQPLSQELKDRVARASQFLYQIQDATTGQVPHYGQTDGALILPLNDCDYLDFRPVVQAVNYLCTGQRCYESGSWDEDLLWLFGPKALEAALQAPLRIDLRADQGGYYTLRAADSYVFTRCATYHDRPGQADMLHVDLWWRGQNIAVDAGTYSYNAPDPWDNSLTSTAYHNTVMVDDLDQMERVSKFMWLPWLHSEVRTMQRAPQSQIAYWEGEHDGYNRLKFPANHRRAIVQLGEETWLVIDAMASQMPHTYRLHWLLADFPCTWEPASGQLQLVTPCGPYYIQMACMSNKADTTLARATQGSPRGWQAPYYYERKPALSLELTTKTVTTKFYTLFSSTPCRVTIRDTTLHIHTEQWEATLNFSTNLLAPLITQLSICGAYQDALTPVYLP